MTTGLLTSHLRWFANQTYMASDNTEACYDLVLGSISCTSYYRGSRYGVEYEGQIPLPYGSLVFGARNLNETETSSNSNPLDSFSPPNSAIQRTNSIYYQYNLPLFSRLDMTFGGRIDAVEDGPSFVTGRVTAAYHIDETERNCARRSGNGGKAPTLYQRFSQYGTANLLPQSNVGGEVGIDQKLFNDRLTLSATAYNAYYRNLIAFGPVSTCSLAQDALGGCYYNIGTAQTRGVEVTADAALVPDVLHARGGYTYNLAVDTQNHINEYRVPLNSGYISARLHRHSEARDRTAAAARGTGSGRKLLSLPRDKRRSGGIRPARLHRELQDQRHLHRLRSRREPDRHEIRDGL